MSNQSKKEKWLLLSILLNTVMAISKISMGIFINSSIIIADGIHSITDIISSFLMFLSIKFSGKKNDRFPFGLHKLEDLTALFGSLIIFYAGYSIIKHTLITKHLIINEHIYLTIGFLIAVLMIQSAFVFLEYRSSKKLNSPGIKTDMLDWIADIATTIIALLGIVLNYNNIPYAQDIAILFIVLMVFHSAFTILKDAVLTLLDASVEIGTLKKAQSIIQSFPEVESVEMLFIRKAGSILIADIMIKIKESNLYKAHKITEEIENKLRENIEHLKIITLHYEPLKHIIKTAYLMDKDKHIVNNLKNIAYITIKDVDKTGKILNTTEYANPFNVDNRGHFMKLLAWLINKKVNAIVLNTDNIAKDKLELINNLDITLQKQ